MIDRVVVAVPACDEAETIGACLRSIALAIEASGVDGAIAVAADSCRDHTEAVVRARRGVQLISGLWHSAGKARQAATELGLAGRPDDRTWIATTDADSTVPEDWIVQQLELAEAGWAAVAGIVRLADDAGPAVRDHFVRTYEVPPDGRHSHVHGANLGVRADALAEVGGWVPVPLAEDHATWRRLKAAGYPIVSSTASWVWTSGRTTGRAAGGFADTLAAAAGGE